MYDPKYWVAKVKLAANTDINENPSSPNPCPL
jgi:hypothetical protein